MYSDAYKWAHECTLDPRHYAIQIYGEEEVKASRLPKFGSIIGWAEIIIAYEFLGGIFGA